MNEQDFVFSPELLVQIANALGLRSLYRVVIDIEYGKFVQVYTIFNDSGKVLRAIDLEALMKGAKITEMGVNVPAKDDAE